MQAAIFYNLQSFHLVKRRGQKRKEKLITLKTRLVFRPKLDSTPFKDLKYYLHLRQKQCFIHH